MRVVTLDLTTGKVRDDLLPPEVISSFVGGRGITTYLLFHSLHPGTDPLSPDCPIIFGTGPLTGMPFPMSGRFLATAKSPLTGTVFTSACGGRLGVHLKKWGIDFLVLRGRCHEPSYVYIDANGPSVRDGGEIWGAEKAQVKKRLRQYHGRGSSVTLIGRAGENLVPFANVETDGRFLGRGGLGATLGSKNVKAIVVAGSNRTVAIPDRERFDFVCYESKKWLAANPVTGLGLQRFGTSILLNYMRETGLLPARNFSSKAPFESAKLSGEMLNERFVKRRKACPFCPIACGRVTGTGDGPEYETLWALGANLAIHDLEKVVGLNDMCNELGVDTITTGATVGAAIELSDKGLLSLGVEYGDAPGVAALIGRIADRAGVGELLSEGSRKLCDDLGSPETAPQVKGLELPAYDPRGAYGHALGYATSNRGGCHMQGYMIGTEILGIPKLVDPFAVAGKAGLLALYQNVSAFMDTLVMCRFSSYALPHDYYARILGAATDRKMTWEESLTVGARIWNLERLFNVREGVAEDSLPERFAEIPLQDLLTEYYAVRGWDSEGIPLPATLSTLGLIW